MNEQDSRQNVPLFPALPARALPRVQCIPLAVSPPSAPHVSFLGLLRASGSTCSPLALAPVPSGVQLVEAGRGGVGQPARHLTSVPAAHP